MFLIHTQYGYQTRVGNVAWSDKNMEDVFDLGDIHTHNEVEDALLGNNQKHHGDFIVAFDIVGE